MSIILVVLLVLSLTIFIWQISNLISIIFGSPFVSANILVMKKAIEKADLKKGDLFFELGCGLGYSLIETQKYGVKAVGLEISPLFYLISRIKTFGFKNIQIKMKNIFTSDLSDADCIYCYLLPELLEKLVPKFKKELKFGTKIISIGFPIKGFKLWEKFLIDNQKVFIYKLS